MSRERYGVIVCSDCQNARCVDLLNKTTKCNHCGNKMKIKRMNIYYTTRSQKEGAWAVRRLNEKLKGKEVPEEEKEPSDPYYKAIKESSQGKDEKERLLIMARVMTRELGEFGRGDIENLAEIGDLGDVDKLIDKIRKIDDIYEPKNETFKIV